MAAQIRQATANSEFIVHYQPVVQLADHVVVGVEALARWQHPKRGLLPPDEFIDDAERSGHIIQLGQNVLQIACKQARVWHDALKIDRLFVAGLGLRTRDSAIAHSIMSLADERGIAVVAEGIETAEQAAALIEMGCRFGQGFLFGRPEPASDRPRIQLPIVS